MTGHKRRCSALRPLVSQIDLPRAWLEAAIVVWRTLLEEAQNEAEEAELLNNLSADLSETGDTASTLEAIGRAVEIYQRLAEAGPERYLPDLALFHGPLGIALRSLGRHEEAAAAFIRGIELIRPFAEMFPEGPAARVLAALEDLLRETEEYLPARSRRKVLKVADRQGRHDEVAHPLRQVRFYVAAEEWSGFGPG